WKGGERIVLPSVPGLTGVTANDINNLAWVCGFGGSCGWRCSSAIRMTEFPWLRVPTAVVSKIREQRAQLLVLTPALRVFGLKQLSPATPEPFVATRRRYPDRASL